MMKSSPKNVDTDKYIITQSFLHKIIIDTKIHVSFYGDVTIDAMILFSRTPSSVRS